jgi:hypothetical protein
MLKPLLTGLLAACCAAAGAQDGLLITPYPAADLRLGERHLRFGLGEVRVDLAVARLGTAQARAQLVCDYYLHGAGEPGQTGLRLTSGLAVGPSVDTTALPLLRLGVSTAGGSLRDAQPIPGADRPAGRVALPYIGLGYTSLAPREGGWGLSADIGLGGLRPGERVRFGAGNPSAAQVENVLNALRLAPVLQLCVSYAF